MIQRRTILGALAMAAGCAAAFGPAAALAQEKIAVAAGQRGFWDSMVVPYGVEAGIFKKHGLEVSVTWTQGGAETLQAVITGSTDYALTNGIEGVLSAYVKGAPLRIVMSQSRGAGDIFYYVKSDSPLKSLKDAEGKTLGFSRAGSFSHAVASALAARAGIKAKLVSTGGLPATRTQVMSGQIDIGWGVPPFLLDQVKAGQVRIIAEGNELKDYDDISVRVNVTTVDFLKKRPAAAAAFAKAYAESVEWMYANMDQSLAWFARDNKVSMEIARDTMKFYPKDKLTPFPVAGVEKSVAESVAHKRLEKPLTAEQIKELVAETR